MDKTRLAEKRYRDKKQNKEDYNFLFRKNISTTTLQKNKQYKLNKSRALITNQNNFSKKQKAKKIKHSR